jgi:hypothetical protein
MTPSPKPMLAWKLYWPIVGNAPPTLNSDLCLQFRADRSTVFWGNFFIAKNPPGMSLGENNDAQRSRQIFLGKRI